MKPVVTWVLLANSGTAHVVVNKGPGKGFSAVAGKTWQAKAPVEYSDKPGIGRASGAKGPIPLPPGDPKAAAQTAFARFIAEKLEDFVEKQKFDRLIIVAAPQMLGELRTAMPDEVCEKIVAQVDKDLTQIPVDKLPKHLADVIAA